MDAIHRKTVSARRIPDYFSFLFKKYYFFNSFSFISAAFLNPFVIFEAVEPGAFTAQPTAAKSRRRSSLRNEIKNKTFVTSLEAAKNSLKARNSVSKRFCGRSQRPRKGDPVIFCLITRPPNDHHHRQTINTISGFLANES